MLTGRRPFESESWIDLLEKHYSEPPPKPRAIVPDLPQSVEDAVLRSLEKDPNRRFSTCSELAVALGCQFLAGPAPLPEILLETEVKKMGGRWKTYRYPFSFRRPRTHLALAPEALWATHRTELMRWPFAELVDLRLRRLPQTLLSHQGSQRQGHAVVQVQESKGAAEMAGRTCCAHRAAEGTARARPRDLRTCRVDSQGPRRAGYLD